MSQHPIATLIRRTSQNIERIANVNVKPLKLTYRQLLVLVAVSKQPGCSQRKITEATGIDRTTVNNIVETLTRGGLLSQPRNDEDRRLTSVTLTKAGEKRCKDGEEILADFDGRLREIIKGEHTTMERAMNKLMEIEVAESVEEQHAKGAKEYLEDRKRRKGLARTRSRFPG